MYEQGQNREEVKKGYQVIEPRSLDTLVALSERRDFALLVLNWLIQGITKAAAEQLRHVEIEVITVTYLGSYPALGIHYPGDDKTDVGPLVEAIAEKILREKPVIDLVEAVSHGIL